VSKRNTGRAALQADPAGNDAYFVTDSVTVNAARPFLLSQT